MGVVDALADAGEALEARRGPHPLRQGPLRSPPDDRAVGERIREGKADLDDVGAALHRSRRASAGVSRPAMR